MIRKPLKADYNYLNSHIAEHKYENAYLYIDSTTYGFEGDNIETHLLVYNNKLKAIIYNYFNSLQVLEIDKPDGELLLEVFDFIKQKNIQRISGSHTMLLRLFQTNNMEYFFTPGHIMRYKYDENYNKSGQSYFASVNDFDEIARLIINDQHLGRSYTLETLVAQLRTRAINDGCENLCIRKNGTIVSHFATYAVGTDIAILSGMITKPEYRGLGYGSTLVKDLSTRIYRNGKMPIIYCYEEEYYTWYKKLGYITIGKSAKLEKR